MGKIKFRMWNKQKGIYANTKDCVYVVGALINNTLEVSADFPEGSALTGNFILEQYVGLKDMNGKEIYEGDVFKDGKHIAEVIFKDGGFGYFAIEQFVAFSGRNDLEEFLSKLEVIGNIHQQIKAK